MKPIPPPAYYSTTASCGTVIIKKNLCVCRHFILIVIGIIFCCTNLFSQSLGLNNPTPDASSILDLTATNRGLLIPRVALTATNAAGPITSPADALIVYNTATAGGAGVNVTPGFYYWSSGSAAWIRLFSGGGSPGVRWDQLVDPANALTLSHGTYVTVFNFANLATDAFTMNASAITTGKLLNLKTTTNTWRGNGVAGGLVDISSTSTGGTAASQSILLRLARSGANANATHTAYGLYSSVTNTGAAASNIAGHFDVSGAAATANTAIEIGNISGATANATGISIGTITGGTAGTYGIQTGAITGVASTEAGHIDLGALSAGGAITSLFGVRTGGITSTSATNTYGLSVNAAGNAISGTGTNQYGIKIGALNGTAATLKEGLNIGAISGSTATARAMNLGAISGGTATNEGIRLGAVTSAGAATVTNGILFSGNIDGGAVAANTTVGINLQNVQGGRTENAGIDIATITAGAGGATLNAGINIGNITAVAGTTTNAAIQLGTISGAATNAYGLNLSTLTGGTTSNNGIDIGTITSTNATNSYGISLTAAGNAISGTGTNQYGIKIGTLNGTAATLKEGLNIGAISGSTTTARAMNLGAISGGTATNEGIRLGAVTSAGAATVTNGILFSGNIDGGAVAANTTVGINLQNVQGGRTKNAGIDIATITAGAGGATLNSGINIGAVTAVAGTTTNAAIQMGNVTGAATNAYGINLATLNGGTTTTRGIDLGNLTASGAGTLYGINIGSLTGGAGAGTYYAINFGTVASNGAATNNGGINLGTISGASTNAYGINLGNLSGGTTLTEGIDLGTITGTSGTTNGINLGAINGGSAAGSSAYGINLSTLTGGKTTTRGIDLGNITGIADGTVYGYKIGSLIAGGGTSTLNVGIDLGNISGTTVDAYGVNLGSLTGGTTSNRGIDIGQITSTGATNSYGLSLNATGTAMTGTGTNVYGIKIGNFTGNTTTTRGIDIGTITGGAATTNMYGINIGAVTGTSTNAYGINIGAVTGATNNYALITAAGRVGINTAAPAYQLDVTGSVAYTGANGDDIFTTAGVSINNPAAAQNIAIRASTGIMSSVFQTTSDARIKNIIGRSNSATDLDILSRIRITDYKMKDTMAFGSRLFKKVIAQDVEEVLPQLVSYTKGAYLPDVYRMSQEIKNDEDGNVCITIENNLHKGDAVVFYQKTTKENKRIEGKVLDAGKDFMVIKCTEPISAEAGNVFVYGHLVNDLRVIDYEGLTTLNISATQELIKKIYKMEDENEQMRKELDQLKADQTSQNKKMEEMMKALLQLGYNAEGRK